MTENILSSSIATQTPLPKTNLSFDLLTNKSKIDVSSSQKYTDIKIRENELRLKAQIKALKMFDAKLKTPFCSSNKNEHSYSFSPSISEYIGEKAPSAKMVKFIQIFKGG